MGEVTQCYYRKAPPKGYPADYYLWPKHQKECKGKKSCAPSPPPISYDKKDIEDFVKKIIPKGKAKKLPLSVVKLEKILLGSELYVGTDALVRLMAVIEEFIKKSGEQNVYIIVGRGDRVLAHTAFFNKMAGKINKTTHLTLEWPSSLQEAMDNFLVSGQDPIRFYAFGKNQMRKAFVKEINRSGTIGRDKCFNTIVADTASRGGPDSRMELKFQIPLRDKFAVENTIERLDPDKKNVVLWGCGAIHADKRRLPATIKHFDPGARVLSIILNGGERHPNFSFDRVADDLGVMENDFFIDFRGRHDFVDADIIYHVAATEDVPYQTGPAAVYPSLDMP